MSPESTSPLTSTWPRKAACSLTYKATAYQAHNVSVHPRRTHVQTGTIATTLAYTTPPYLHVRACMGAYGVLRCMPGMMACHHSKG